MTIIATTPLFTGSRCFGSFTFDDGTTVRVSGGLICSQHGRRHCKHHKAAHAAILAARPDHDPEPDPSGSPSQPQTQTALLEALPVIQRTAIRLTAAYSWANPHVEVDDLTQLGTLACLEASRRGLRVVGGNPTALLVAIARRAMQRRCDQLTGLVGLPRR